MKIRKMRETDEQDLYEVLSDPDVMRYIEPPFSMEQTRKFIKECGMCEPPRVYAVENDNEEFVGYVIFHEYDSDSMEIGWLLKKKYWGKGYATKLTRELLGKARTLGKNAVIECDPEQEITKRIANNLGFKYMGIEDDMSVFVKSF